jgi:hypothetical protein
MMTTTNFRVVQIDRDLFTKKEHDKKRPPFGEHRFVYAFPFQYHQNPFMPKTPSLIKPQPDVFSKPILFIKPYLEK